ncbi:MAG: hypothetical protein GY771_05375 [bacterium]|nr:hypothetical protein [bacterium]
MVGNKADGDRVVTWLKREKAKGRLDVGLILWRVKAHYDHIHVEGLPKKTGTPPKINKEAEQVKELVTNLQKALNTAGAKDRNGNKLKADGIWGPMTESAFVNGLRLDNISGKQIKGTFVGTLKQ